MQHDQVAVAHPAFAIESERGTSHPLMKKVYALCVASDPP